MGLFSKKTIKCERCGEEYQVRFTRGPYVCDACLRRESEKKRIVTGYVDYASRMKLPDYTEEQLDQIATHRTTILKKYQQVNGISRTELMNVSDNYKKLSDDQAEEVLVRIAHSTITSTLGAAYTSNFFVLTEFEKTIIDAEDVFAVGYTNDYNLHVAGQEVILCAIFTNDPYIPVFPMIYATKLGFFDIIKGKKGGEGVTALFETICPNLTYPVQDLKQLNKQLKSDGNVQGNIDLKTMLKMISDASSGIGIFYTKEMSSVLDSSSAEMLDKYGYIQEGQVNQLLKMDKMFNRKFWEKHINRLTK